MTIVAHSRPFVVGVDTHAKTHTYAVIDPMGQLLGCEQFPTTAQGVARAIAWVGRRSRGQAEALWVIECVATYGARLAHAAAEAGYEVAEAPPPRWRWTRPGCADPAPMRACAKPCGCWWPPAIR